MLDTVPLEQHSNRSSRAPSHASHASQEKARTLTESSAASNASTLKEAIPREPPREMRTDTLMDAIFSAVVLPQVEFHQKEEMSVLDRMDSELEKEASQSYRSSTTSLGSPTSPAVAVAKEIVEAAVQEHFHDHEPSHDAVLSELSRLQREAAEKEAEAVMRELEDAFEPDQPLPPSRRGSQGYRMGRSLSSMTIDSTASAAESRYGGFDVHDDDGNYCGDEINLEHNEVAYVRIEKPETNGVHTYEVKSNEEQVKELEETHSRLMQAKQEIAFLESQLLDAQGKTGQRRAPSLSNGNKSHSYDTPPADDRFRNEVNGIYEEDVGISDIAREQLYHGKEVGKEGKKTLIVPQQKEVGEFQKHGNIRKIVLGGDQHPSREDKTVLLFGTVGSGKTSLINSMLNYLYDVKRENGFRFVIAEKKAPSTGLRAYVFNNTILPFSVTIVDTPGVPDIKGDRRVSTLVETWFKHELLWNGRFRLDAISIVLKKDEKRLEWPFIHELAEVKKMFGDDLKTNILPIITHTEVLPQPVAVRALAQANISFLQYYKVNSGGFAPLPTPDTSKLMHNLYYRHGIASLETYFKDLQELVHPLLAVLRTPQGILEEDLY